MEYNLRKLMFWSCLSIFIPQIIFAFCMQYTELYMFQHIDVQQKAIVAILGNVCGVIAYMALSNEKILNIIVKHIKIFIILEMIFFNVSHWIIPDYPWFAMIGLTISNHLIMKVNDVIFEDLHNKWFKGRDRTILSTKRKLWKMIGILVGSSVTLLLLNLTIQQIIYIALIGDITVLIMHWILYEKLK